MTAAKAKPAPPQWPADQVERRKVADLIAYARNARLHSAEQIEAIAASITEFGWTIPALVDEHGVLIAGHGQVSAAKRLKLDTIPVMVARGWTEAQIRAYRIADNKLPESATWDLGMLKVELSDLRAFAYDLSLTGFQPPELVTFFAQPTPPEGFKAFNEDIDTEHECPKCKYRWSGKSAPAEAAK